MPQEELMELRLELTRIEEIAHRYTYTIDDTEVIEVKPEIERKGYISKDQLRKIAHWKAPRSAGHVQKNSDDFIEEITRLALRGRSERARIESLTVLDGG